MTSPACRGTRIGQARVRASGADAASCAARCAGALPDLDLEPATMPPQAILCVRSLPDPLPGGIDARSRHVTTRPVAWEAAMRASLRDRLQHAARPADGPVPATAGAVLFADPSELLACAARDACRGPLAWWWWWRHLFADASFDRVADAWQREPAYVPAAFDALTKLGAATEWMSRLPPGRAAALLDAVLRAHALPSLADAIASALREPARIESDEPADSERSADFPAQPRRDRGGARAAVTPPWRGIAPAEWDQPPLDLSSRAFAAMCLVLRRSPGLPRRSSFAPAVVAYLVEARRREANRRRDEAQHVVRRAPVDRPAPVPAVRPLIDRLASPAPPRTTAPLAPVRDLTTPPSAPEPASRDPGTGRPTQSDRRGAAPPLRSVPRRSLGASAEVTTDAGSAREGPSGTARGRPPVATDTGPPDEAPSGLGSAIAPDAAASIESAYAGAFFLINVAVDLELYSHGVTVSADIEMGVWRFLDVTVRALVRERDDEDSIWALLASLADANADPDLPGAEPDLPPAERDRLVARVRARLTDLLDVEEPGVFLVEQRGRITRSPGHLDVHFSLEHHPIEIRLARLDRNPGWIPAAGVHVGFYFD